MNRKIILYLLLFVFISSVKCEETAQTKSKNPSIPYFRRKVEELGDTDFFETTETGDPRNLVAFLVKNVKEIFDDILDTSKQASENLSVDEQPTPSITNGRPSSSLTTVLIKPTLDFSVVEDIMSSIATPTYTNNLILNENLLDEKQSTTKIPKFNTAFSKNDLVKLAKNLKTLVNNDKIERNYILSPFVANSTDADGDMSDPRRSCILCNNVMSEDCNDPKNKLISSVMCERDDDMCYSLHTPFGIVDRGCFNVNHNLTTYICSCNLCNYISISEMPFMFGKKQDWVDNVIELSRTKHFRKSVFKDMSCLKCEVNTTTRTGDMLDSANCLEGNIGTLPVEDCNVDEICAVKALRADGYIWRGCVKAPLYNYWWTVCDGDLCNYDSLTLIQDFII